MASKLAVATFAALGLPSLAGAQAPTAHCERPFEAVKIVVQLDATGISSWRYLNPLRPFPVVLPKQTTTPKEALDWERCAEDAEVSFVNSASGQGLVVTIPYVYRRFNARLVTDGVGPRLAAVVSAMQPARAFTDAASEDEKTLKVIVTTGIDAQEGSLGFFELLPEAVNKLNDVVTQLNHASVEVRRLPNEEAKQHESQDWRQEVGKHVRQAADAGKASAPLLKESVSRSTKLREAIATWGKTARSADAIAIANQLTNDLLLLEASLEEAFGAVIGVAEPPPPKECPDQVAERQVCNYRYTLFDNDSFKIDPATWERLIRFSEGVLAFKVGFFDASIPLSNAEGYLRVRVKPAERKTALSWAFNGGVGYSVKPFSPRKRPEDSTIDRPFTLADPYTGRTVDAFSGSARFDLGLNVRDLARVSVSPQFKDGSSLGERDESRTVTVPQYTIDSFGANGVSLRFGKYTMFKPARGIAINASGEGFQFNFRNMSIGHVVKKESVGGAPDDANEDESQTVARITGARGFSIFRRVDAFLLFGEQRRRKDTPYDYTTLGTQMFFADSTERPRDNEVFSSFSGNVAYFYSDRDAGTPPAAGKPKVIDGTGHVWLIDAGLTLLRKVGSSPVPQRSFGFLLGAGTGDDPNTTNRDESFVGERAGFGGFDSLFLSSFTTSLQDGDPLMSPVGGGLVNKAYAGLSYTERSITRINLLWWLSRALQLSDVATSPATIFRAQAFRLDQPFQDRRDAGWEAGLLWQIEVPAGVTESIGCNRYFPGSATEDFFSATPMSCSAQVSLNLK